jgi:hypothetical protein
MTAGTTLFCPPECNPTYGHIEVCERYNPRDPKAKLRAQLEAAQERVQAELRGEYPPQPQRVEMPYRQVPDPAYAQGGYPGGPHAGYSNGAPQAPHPSIQQRPAFAPGPMVAPPLPPSPPPARPLLELSRAAFLAYCGAGTGNVPTDATSDAIVSAAGKLLANVDELEERVRAREAQAAALVKAEQAVHQAIPLA